MTFPVLPTYPPRFVNVVKERPPLNICPSGFPVCVCLLRDSPPFFSVRHIVLSNRHVCVPLEVTFSFSDWIRREWLDQLNTNVHFEKLQSGKKHKKMELHETQQSQI